MLIYMCYEYRSWVRIVSNCGFVLEMFELQGSAITVFIVIVLLLLSLLAYKSFA